MDNISSHTATTQYCLGGFYKDGSTVIFPLAHCHGALCMRSEKKFIMVTRGHDELCSFIKTYVLQYPRLPPLCLNSRCSILVSQPIKITFWERTETIITFSLSIPTQLPTAPVQAYRSPSGALTPVWTLQSLCARLTRTHNAHMGWMSWSRTSSDGQDQKSRGGANRERICGGIPKQLESPCEVEPKRKMAGDFGWRCQSRRSSTDRLFLFNELHLRLCMCT